MSSLASLTVKKRFCMHLEFSQNGRVEQKKETLRIPMWGGRSLLISLCYNRGALDLDWGVMLLNS